MIMLKKRKKKIMINILKKKKKKWEEGKRKNGDERGGSEEKDEKENLIAMVADKLPGKFHEEPISYMLGIKSMGIEFKSKLSLNSCQHWPLAWSKWIVEDKELWVILISEFHTSKAQNSTERIAKNLER